MVVYYLPDNVVNYNMANMSDYYFQPFSHEQLLVNFALLFPISITWNMPAPLPEMCFKVTQSCLTLCNPMDYTVHGILQARIVNANLLIFQDSV